MADPYLYKGKPYDQLTDEERKAAQEELTNQVHGYEALQRPTPASLAPAGMGGGAAYGAMAGSIATAPGDIELQNQLLPRLNALRTQESALAESGKQAEVKRIAEEARRRLDTAAGRPDKPPPPRTMQEAIMEGGGEVGGTPTVPAAALQAAGPQFKNTIVSRRTPDGRIVFETQMVPVDLSTAALAVERPDGYQGPGLGVEEWRARALAENPQRAAATAAHPGIGTSGEMPQGFLVRAGEGGYGASRQIPALSKSFEEVMSTESPLVQDKWLEAKAKSLGIGAQEAQLLESETRRKLGGAQAGVAEEQLRRLKDPAVEVRDNFAMHDAIMQRINPQVAAVVGTKLSAAIDVLTKQLGGPPPTAIVDAIRNRLVMEQTGKSYDEMLNQVMGTVPGVAAAKARVPNLFGG